MNHLIFDIETTGLERTSDFISLFYGPLAYNETINAVGVTPEGTRAYAWTARFL